VTIKYLGHWIDIYPTDHSNKYEVVVDDEMELGIIPGKDEAIGQGKQYIDEMIDVAQHDSTEPDEPDRDTALEWGGVNYP
jgi:hypothetical protein